MRAVSEIKREHVVIREKLRAILRLFDGFKDRGIVASSLEDFEDYWTRHEEKEERYFDVFVKGGGIFPFHKTLVREHDQLKGHWKVLQDFLKKKSDAELKVALDTDGRMLVNKILRHSEIEDEYFDRYFSK